MKRCTIFKPVLAILLMASVLLFMNPIAFAAEPSNITVEGEDNFFVTGESYPTLIQMAGYNSRDNILYINSEFETTKTVNTGEVATFNYYMEIFKGDGTTLGSLGSYATPQTVAGATSATTASITNRSITLTGALTVQNRVVITIKDVTIATP